MTWHYDLVLLSHSVSVVPVSSFLCQALTSARLESFTGLYEEIILNYPYSDTRTDTISHNPYLLFSGKCIPLKQRGL